MWPHHRGECRDPDKKAGFLTVRGTRATDLPPPWSSPHILMRTFVLNTNNVCIQPFTLLKVFVLGYIWIVQET